MNRVPTIVLACLGLIGCRPSPTATPESRGAADDRDLTIVLPPRWRALGTVAPPMETLAFRGGHLARAVNQNGVGELQLWDVWKDRPIADLGHARTRPRIIRMSMDAERLALLRADGSLELWDSAVGRKLRDLGELGDLESLRFSENGRVLVAACPDMVFRIWDGRTGRPVQQLGPFPPGVLEGVVSPDGTRLVVRSKNGPQLWDVTTGNPIANLTGSPFRVTQYAFSPDSRRLVEPTARGGAILRSADASILATFDAPPTEANKDHVTLDRVVWSPEGRWFAVDWLSQHPTSVYAASDGRRAVTADYGNPNLFAFSDDERAVAIQQHGAVYWYTLPGGKPKMEQALSADGIVFRRGSDSPTLLGGRAEYAEKLAIDRVEIGDFTELRRTRDGKWLIANETTGLGRSYGEPAIFDAKTLKRLTPAPGHRIYGARFTPDGRRLITGGARVQVWTADSLDLRMQCPRSKGSPFSGVTVLDRGRLVLATRYEGATIYELSRAGCRIKETIARLGPTHGPRWDAVTRTDVPDALLLAEASGHIGPQLRSMLLPGPLGRERNMPSGAAVLSPDGRTLAVAGYDGALYGFSQRGRQWAFASPDPDDYMNQGLEIIAYGQDGRHVVGLGEQGEVRVFDLERKTTSTRFVLEEELSPYTGDLEMAASDAYIVLRHRDTLRVIPLSGDEGEDFPALAGVQTFALTPDGTRTAVAIGDTTCNSRGCRGATAVRLLELDGLDEVTSTSTPLAAVGTMTFAHDGGQLALTGSALHLLAAPTFSG